MSKKLDNLYAAREKCPVCRESVSIRIAYNKTFSVQCFGCGKKWILPTKMDMCERFPLRPRTASMRQAIDDWNRLAQVETWRKTYLDSGDSSLVRNIDRDDDGTPIHAIGRYEIVFDFDSVRYYCYIDAVTIDEAMDTFWTKHPGVTLRNIVDTLEV